MRIKLSADVPLRLLFSPPNRMDRTSALRRRCCSRVTGCDICGDEASESPTVTNEGGSEESEGRGRKRNEEQGTSYTEFQSVVVAPDLPGVGPSQPIAPRSASFFFPLLLLAAQALPPFTSCGKQQEFKARRLSELRRTEPAHSFILPCVVAGPKSQALLINMPRQNIPSVVQGPGSHHTVTKEAYEILDYLRHPLFVLRSSV